MKDRGNIILKSIFVIVAISLIILISLVFWQARDDLGITGELIIRSGAATLLVGIIFAVYIVISKSIHSAVQWVEKADTGNKRAEALNVDFVDESVHYTAKRLGVQQRISFPPVSEKGRFMIDGEYITVGDIAFSKNDIQWLGLYKKSSLVRLDVTINAWWYQITIHPGYGAEAFLQELRKRVPEKLNQSRYTNRPEVRTYAGVPAHRSTQNLQGIFEKHEALELHITPLWLVILQDAYVVEQHFIDDIVDMRCSKHPTDLDDDMLLLSFEVDEAAFAYALKDKTFATRLSDASKQGVDATATRKKKQQDSEA